jgi:uncharacterized membrane protein (Fun14 family)
MASAIKAATADTGNASEENPNKLPVPVLLASKGVMGVVAGYMVGSFAKQVTDMACLFAGMGCLFLGGLHYMKWVTVNFAQIDSDLLHVWDRAKTRAHD